jgi:hypothetical protein
MEWPNIAISRGFSYRVSKKKLIPSRLNIWITKVSVFFYSPCIVPCILDLQLCGRRPCWSPFNKIISLTSFEFGMPLSSDSQGQSRDWLQVKNSSSSISVPSASSNTLQSAGSVIPNFTLPKINKKRRSFTKLFWYTFILLQDLKLEKDFQIF